MGPVTARSQRRRAVRQPPAIPGRTRAGRVSVIDRGAVPADALSATIGNELTDRLEAQRASWDSLKNDIYASPLATEPFRQAFMRDANAFLQFERAHAGDWVVTHTALTMSEQYRHTLESWRQRFERLGGRSTAGPTEAPPPGLIDQAGGAARVVEEAGSAIDAIKWVAGAAVVVALVYGVTRVL